MSGSTGFRNEKAVEEVKLTPFREGPDTTQPTTSCARNWTEARVPASADTGLRPLLKPVKPGSESTFSDADRRTGGLSRA
jgi:hypothetical protein